jgi:hypothetical protein
MVSNKQKYFYVIVREKDDKMLLFGGQLPIYWNKGVATNKCAEFKGFIVKKMLAENLDRIISWSPPVKGEKQEKDCMPFMLA